VIVNFGAFDRYYICCKENAGKYLQGKRLFPLVHHREGVKRFCFKEKHLNIFSQGSCKLPDKLYARHFPPITAPATTPYYKSRWNQTTNPSHLTSLVKYQVETTISHCATSVHQPYATSESIRPTALDLHARGRGSTTFKPLFSIICLDALYFSHTTPVSLSNSHSNFGDHRIYLKNGCQSSNSSSPFSA
jgi:hypothetical protein